MLPWTKPRISIGSLIWHLTQFSALIVHRLTFIFWFVQAQWKRRKIIDSWYRQGEIVLGWSLGLLGSQIFRDSPWTTSKEFLAACQESTGPMENGNVIFKDRAGNLRTLPSQMKPLGRQAHWGCLLEAVTEHEQGSTKAVNRKKYWKTERERVEKGNSLFTRERAAGTLLLHIMMPKPSTHVKLTWANKRHTANRHKNVHRIFFPC